MTYDSRTVLERYRLTATLSPEMSRPQCSLLADGLPPTDRAQCESLGCFEPCRGLSVVAKAAYETAVAKEAERVEPKEVSSLMDDFTAIRSPGDGAT
jgi:hypothetical protein